MGWAGSGNGWPTVGFSAPGSSVGRALSKSGSGRLCLGHTASDNYINCAWFGLDYR